MTSLTKRTADPEDARQRLPGSNVADALREPRRVRRPDEQPLAAPVTTPTLQDVTEMRLRRVAEATYAQKSLWGHIEPRAIPAVS
jgi:hypothetical protein